MRYISVVSACLVRMLRLPAGGGDSHPHVPWLRACRNAETRRRLSLSPSSPAPVTRRYSYAICPRWELAAEMLCALACRYNSTSRPLPQPLSEDSLSPWSPGFACIPGLSRASRDQGQCQHHGGEERRIDASQMCSEGDPVELKQLLSCSMMYTLLSE